MSTLDTYRRLAPDHPVWQRRPSVADPGGALESTAPRAFPTPGADATPGSGEDGSLITEYGLLAIVAATVAAAVISWASDGAMASLFDSLLQQARGVVGG